MCPIFAISSLTSDPLRSGFRQENFAISGDRLVCESHDLCFVGIIISGFRTELESRRQTHEGIYEFLLPQEHFFTNGSTESPFDT